ncbi:MAG: DUF2130 domain-containing protein [Clostridiales bacterium]|nr:DUF2130 domain-containing protein [Clostridiales bacterium]
MQEIRCPKCGEVFQVDETGYNQIVQQVRDKEFETELKRRERDLIAKRDSELRVIRMQEEKQHTASITEKEAEIAARDRQIAELRAKIEAGETAKSLAVSEALKKRNEEFSAETKKYSESISKRDAAISSYNQKITELQARLKAGETEKRLAVSEAVEKKNREISQKVTEIADLKGELKSKETESRLSEKALQEQYEEKLKLKDEQIEYYKDFKARQSTKMIGESLEQHCLTQFNSIRMTAFPNAYFEKDNDARSGSKGDFIYRECSEDGTEFISIMFEMKNEADTTSTKHKNEDFFKELDKDRREKGCEYAILVSLLEIDNDFYNNGIVDVSYRYPKMYVIRPQFFIPIITLLRNASQNSLKYKQELQIVRSQQVDISHFEENMQLFKEGFARNYRLASERFNTAIEEIDKTIDHLQKTKSALLSSENNLRLANKKADDLSIKRLTKNAPSVKAMFDELKAESEN